jgi:transcriptional regulator with XRE-family HTH domain
MATPRHRRPVVGWIAPLVMERHKAGMTQQEVADRLGVSLPTISSMECGTRRPNLVTLGAYANLFDMEMGIVFTKKSEL